MSDLIGIVLLVMFFSMNIFTTCVFIYIFKQLTKDKNNKFVQPIDNTPISNIADNTIDKEPYIVPLNEFNPDFSKPIKLVFNEDSNQSSVEEVLNEEI